MVSSDMAFTKSEQRILDAFALQLKNKPGRRPVFVADGTRLIKAAELLVEKGLAEMTNRETFKRKWRGRIISSVYVQVQPKGVEPKANENPKSKTTLKAKPAKRRTLLRFRQG